MGQRPGAGDCRARGDPGRTRRTGRRALPPPPRPGARAAVTSRATRQPLAPPGRARAAAEHMGPRAGRAGGDRVEEEQSGAASKDGHPYLPEPPSGFSLGKDVGGPGDPWDKAGSTLQVPVRSEFHQAMAGDIGAPHGCVPEVRGTTKRNCRLHKWKSLALGEARKRKSRRW
ncbi:uncharacterized protein LOC107142918 isoform X2 [Marmota marmota marmota]|uniref:uncharacterized protein LOC107142918 isoform X2 n=1 Tax=Marmota marmota marmota TaxID=9994 RepID=UPI002093F97B|nr:uncharacterized protein LOC107142918 isoform X2 [Marmota marmota marmota]